MKLRNLIGQSLLGVATVTSLSISGCNEKLPDELPNILWLTSEDNSPLLGCYGDEFATTPNLDKLASEGFLYTHAYANAPVCAPARNTIITGVFPNSGGNQHMRSTYSKSDIIKTYPEFLREAGYYCTNNVKTDYNTESIDPDLIWDECSREAHYKNREPGQPFFAVFNSMISHESSIHRRKPLNELRHNPKEVILPPYHPDTPDMRHDWAQYYDKIEDMDAWVGEKLKELEDAGLAENTIIFYYGDHGGVLARSKRYVYETGTRVPFIVRIPEKFKHLFPTNNPGSKVNRLISFVDLAPTLLSIAGIEIPKFMQGNAFLGKQTTKDPKYTHMFRGRMDERYDMSRAVRDDKYRYIRNYMPYRIYGQQLAYLWQAPSIRSWEQAYLNGECSEIQSAFWNTKPVEELYDTENDPWEINNLANKPEYKDILERMRNENFRWMKEVKDVGLIPETEYSKRNGSRSMYDYMRSDECPFDEILQAAELSTFSSNENIAEYIEFLKNEDSAIRYWGVTGLLIHKNLAKEALPELKNAVNEESAATASLIAETLYHLGEEIIAQKIYLRILTDEKYNMYDRNFALNSIDAINFRTTEIEKAIKELYENKIKDIEGFAIYSTYDVSMSKTILEKWEIL